MNIRTQRTKTALREALLACMREKPVTEITAAEICERAGLNRATFYNHYKDVAGIVREAEQEQLEIFRGMLRENKISGAALLGEILNSLDRAKTLYHMEYDAVAPEGFRRGVIATAREEGLAAWKKRLPGLSEKEAELSYEGLLNGTLAMALSESIRYDRETVIRTIMGMAYAYIDACERASAASDTFPMRKDA